SGISTPVDVNVLYNSGIIAVGGIYGYDGSYINAEMIDPGRGYWVRALDNGEITLSSTALATKTVEQVNHLEGSNTLELSNGTHSSTLYFGKDVAEEHRDSYSLPPTFPQMAFDVRFNGDMKYTMVSGDIEVLNTSNNLTISYDIVLDTGEHMDWVLTSASGEEYLLEGTGSITIPSAERFVLNRGSVIPITFVLHQNFPNPFNPITTLRYDLPSNVLVTLSIYDMLGREVAQLVNTTQEAGYRSVQWDATDSFGKIVSAGFYLYQVRAGEFVQTKKMVLLK
ncbi:MAG TPA: T9SS type A sorting domain-containing protein, partial [Candidatus Marinimicrobia bacterium]|nr:T9SS type A sorting domain-containing protein [Candidatus Neomarinimicrobiota bacterium]